MRAEEAFAPEGEAEERDDDEHEPGDDESQFLAADAIFDQLEE